MPGRNKPMRGDCLVPAANEGAVVGRVFQMSHVWALCAEVNVRVGDVSAFEAKVNARTDDVATADAKC